MSASVMLDFHNQTPWDRMFPESNNLGRYFHEFFKIYPDQQRKRLEWKKGKKAKNLKRQENWRSQLDICSDAASIAGAPEVEICCNASGFAVFANVRQIVFERWLKQATQIYLASSSNAPPLEGGLDGDSDVEDGTADRIREATPVKVPKVVGIGLRSILELIRESRSSHPEFCTKALNAALDVLQGQQPEGLKGEPSDVIDTLFDLLLYLATSHGPESDAPNDGTHLTAVACTCLLSLVIVRGDTGKLLKATAALLMCPIALHSQNIKMPLVMPTLQRSVHGALIGKVIRPDWMTHGITYNSRIDSFPVDRISEIGAIVPKALASDGEFIYMHTSNGLIKIGSGYRCTTAGYIVLYNNDFFPDETGWLGYCNGRLFFKRSSKRAELLVVDRNSLTVCSKIPLDSRHGDSGVMFSDGENLGMIAPAKDDGFVVRTLNPTANPPLLVSELALKLARKCMDVLGAASFDEDSVIHTLQTGCEEEISSVYAGKDFGLIRTTSGKVLYSGKASSLGVKQCGQRTSRWQELPITKSLKVVHIAVGHDGLHAIMLTESGTALFTGTARRGEDGDHNKARRQPKAVKPKKMMKVDGQMIVDAACNNGSTALVTREGELLMFGKDTTHCDPTTGQVMNLKDVTVTQIALGKAHAVALTNKGQVYTFGINNKGQCGRDLISQVKETPMVVAMETTGEEDGEEELEWEDIMCSSGKHKWRSDQCMVCTVCRECTGYSISCLSSVRPDRNPGQQCGCGEGDSGCDECGCCRICAREYIDNSEVSIIGPSGMEEVGAEMAGLLRFDLIYGERGGESFEHFVQRRLDERQLRQKAKLSGGAWRPSSGQARTLRQLTPEQRAEARQKMAAAAAEAIAGTAAGSAAGTASSTAGLVSPGGPLAGTSSSVDAAGNSSGPSSLSPTRLTPAAAFLERSGGASGADTERDASRVISLTPARLYLPIDTPVVLVSCGLHHTALLTQCGKVLTFGSNLHGQLGQGDLLARGSPHLVRLPTLANPVHVACGSNHTAILTIRGEVYTFGSYSKGQLGRPAPDVATSSQSLLKECGRTYRDKEGLWYATPAPVPDIGPRHGRRATWVGASGDQTFLRIDESLINTTTLARSTVLANKSSIILVPTESEISNNSFRCLVISKRDGNCSSFTSMDQVDFSNCLTALDPMFNVIWSFEPTTNSMVCYNALACESRLADPLILSSALAVPVVSSCFVTRADAAVYLLCCLDTLTSAQENISVCKDPAEKGVLQAKVYSREDFAAVNRFESHGGGWGYSAHSIEAIRFMADTDILLGGFGLFGGRGEYTGKIQLFDIGMDGGEQETDGEMLAETDEIPYECGPRQKYPMLFEEPIPLQANRWYVAWARVNGPSSDCGSNGHNSVNTEDQVMFNFKTSKKSNNGTDVNAGQIPQILYKVVIPENQAPTRQVDQSDPVYILSRDFSRAVSSNSFHSLLALLKWSWGKFRDRLKDLGGVSPQSSGGVALERLIYLSRASLRLLCTYIIEIYPNQVSMKKMSPESVELAECVGEVRTLLRQILSDPAPVLPPKHSGKIRLRHPTLDSLAAYNKMVMPIIEECHQAFVTCFHAFYPTAFLKWTCLCDLLASADKGRSDKTNDRLLSAVLAALCSPTVRLRSTFPILSSFQDASDASLKRRLSPSDNTGLPMMPCMDGHHYPILVEQMSYCSQKESNEATSSWTFREVLEHLLDMVSLPVQQQLCQKRPSFSSLLVMNCCRLLARVVAELSSQSSGGDEDLEGTCGRILHSTPSRFTRTNQSRTWNTGSGSPDAICFVVDRPGIAIAGVTVYGGAGSYEYELELLDDQSNTESDPPHTQRWDSLELVRGTFNSDDCAGDVVELKFDKLIPIKEAVKYAIRLRNHGGRTSNGDGGLSSVKGPDGVTFTFSSCSLCFNGTTQTRGQIPQILYYSNPQDSENQQSSRVFAELQARKATLSLASAVVQRCAKLLSLAREKAEDVPSTEILATAPIVTTLMPLILAHISTLAISDPRSGIQVLSIIHELVPHTAALNLLQANLQPHCNQHYAWVESEHPYRPAMVSSYRVSFPETVKWMVIEFDPLCGTAQAEDSLQLYIPRLESPSSPGCRRSDRSREDVTLLGATIGDSDGDLLHAPFWPVLHKFSGSPGNWPQAAVILPGNEVIFSLETASDYVKDEKACFYGFRCLVVGYEWHEAPHDGLLHLEAELAFLGGMCAASLMSKELTLPPLSLDEIEDDIDLIEEQAQQVYNAHSVLLGRGFALSAPPTITQALDGVLPFSCQSKERMFLRDLVASTPGTSGGRFARWLQPDPHVDPALCELRCNGDDFRCGWPALLTVLTKDQYGDVVHVPSLKIEVKAVPIEKDVMGEDVNWQRRSSEPDTQSVRSRSCSPLDVPYEVTVKDKTCYHSISVMKAYENYSFEELRYTSPAIKRSSENMLVRPNGDGTYSANWTPASIGCYSIIVSVDSYVVDESYKVEVKETPQGMVPPTQNIIRKAPYQPSRLRKFVASNSAGLRVRAHPSLQSEQIGIVPVSGVIAFIDEIHNDNGVWLRLSVDTIRSYCPAGAATEAWCLQYNQHLGKTLLFPVEEPRSLVSQVLRETIMKRIPDVSKEGAKSVCMSQYGTYTVVKCGASGHNVRRRPNLKAPPVGMLVFNNTVDIVDYVVNCEGTWVQLDKETMSKVCFNTDGEAWSLAQSPGGTVYLRPEGEQDPLEAPFSSPKRGFDFLVTSPFGAGGPETAPSSSFAFSGPSSGSSGSAVASFGDAPTPATTATTTSSNPFVFGSFISQFASQKSPKLRFGSQADRQSDRPHTPVKTLKHKEESSRFATLQRWLVGDSKQVQDKLVSPSSRSNVPPELAGVSVKDLVKAIGESRANGNGASPPGTPRRVSSRSSSPKAVPLTCTALEAQRSGGGGLEVVYLRGAGSSSSSPIASTEGRTVMSGGSTPLAGGSPRSYGVSPLVSSPQRRGSTQSDTSAIVSSLTRDASASPGVSHDLSPGLASRSPTSSLRSDGSVGTTATSKGAPDQDAVSDTSSVKSLSQTGTQTSPDDGPKAHFSIGSGQVTSTTSAKDARKPERSYKGRGSKKNAPSATPTGTPTGSPMGYRERHRKEPVKEALGPAVAESLRAVFAAFLWHEGLVHDAMACSSFLKFHPNLPKQGAVVVTRHQPGSSHSDKVLQRHSVEVLTAGNYLHLQPATLETLTRSAANANANRNRNRKQQQASVIKEDGGSGGTHAVAVLPPALRALVFLWEQLSTSCLHMISQQSMLPSPTFPPRPAPRIKRDKSASFKDRDGAKDPKEPRRSYRKKKDWRSVGIAGGILDRETMCELCANYFPPPVTYHMRVAHPGCGAHAGGMGYNSGGLFCVGWAGNCGDGGVGGSSWYLVCNTCRERYLRLKKAGLANGAGSSRQRKGVPTRKKGVVAFGNPGSPVGSPAGSAMNGPIASAPLETHLVMRNNAMFLLDLSSAAGTGPQIERRTSPSMPSVAEQPDSMSPFGDVGPFQCLAALGAHPSELREESALAAYARHGLPDSAHNGNIHHSGSARPVSEFPMGDIDSDEPKLKGFHRSMSMGTNGTSWNRRDSEGKVVTLRRRNNSGSEVAGDSGSYLLCYPSAALQRLVPHVNKASIVSANSAQLSLGVDIMSRPVMAFLYQQHNLDCLQFAMKHALRKAACRVYAMQALNWLLHNVTQPMCLHDLLWWLVAALSPSQETEMDVERREDHDLRGACGHPLSDISIAGEATHPLPSVFHTLLQSVADLMLLLPPGSALQQAAVRCWGLKFTQADHMFLHRSQVFSNISKILSRSEEEQDDLSVSMHESHQSTHSHVTSCVEELRDITSEVDIKASSRQAMVGSLTDSSTETFWESGDEDRNKTKTITLICQPHSAPHQIFIHVDNCRDLANKVSSVTFLSGPNADELYRLQQVEVENRYTGWVCCPILDSSHVIVRLELKGPDNSLRIRQIRILGESVRVGPELSANTIQQRNCDAETLRVFRLITAQVFGKLIQQYSDSDLPESACYNQQTASNQQASGSALPDVEPQESNDLKEHMVGILFSRSKLSHLQTQVCMHIVQTIRKETQRVREDWDEWLKLMNSKNKPLSEQFLSMPKREVPGESSVQHRQIDSYCFEMLSMVLALSGSSVGKAYLAQQHGLLQDLLTLLHVGSPRVQRQVTALLRRMLQEVSPSNFASIIDVKSLPPADFSIVTASSKSSQSDCVFNIHRVGILDVFLCCIAKALTVQVRAKGRESAASKGQKVVTVQNSITIQDNVGSRWWLRGWTPRKLAEVIILLLKDMAAGKLSETWAEVTKSAIAENILNLTKLDESQRVPAECLRTPTLWMALASLCVLDSDHVERLSSGEWSAASDGQPPPPRPTCSNHDDGETSAIIQCSKCGNLCADCDRYLHLHRRTRMHQRTVCKEEEEAIKVDLHEGCGRTKLFWVLALADSSTLKAMVEFRERRTGRPSSASSVSAGTGTCRFCGTSGSSGLLAIGNVCADQECQDHARNACPKHHPCGHLCGGISSETSCLPCLLGCSGNSLLKQDADDMCMICFTEALSCAPAIQLQCGHVFHLHCCQNVLRKRWPGPRITFAFAQCPICKFPMEHSVLSELLAPVRALLEDVRRKALMRLEYEGLHKAEAITTQGGRFYNDPASFAMDRYAYYVCYKCNKAYYGGEARCDAELGEEYDPTELVCGGCSDVARAQMCPKHGTDFLEYKCRFCCSVAVFFCFGTTHFCNPCHDDFQRVTSIPRMELPMCPAGPKGKQMEGDECPLHVKHPPTGEEFALGCGVCRNAHTF